jgi:hypothetical protein
MKARVSPPAQKRGPWFSAKISDLAAIDFAYPWSVDVREAKQVIGGCRAESRLQSRRQKKAGQGTFVSTLQRCLTMSETFFLHILTVRLSGALPIT